MNEKASDISARKKVLNRIGQDESITARMEIRKLIKRLRGSYLEMESRYQRLDESYRKSIAIIMKGSHPSRRVNKSKNIMG